MRVEIEDGVQLYFDVDGFGLVPDGDVMVERPTLVLLHGGPGFDHSMYKTDGRYGSELADVAQVVMYDHRGQGRSDRRPIDEMTLDTWADDVVRFCDALGIERPIVLGASFGSFVAQRYLGRHPDHPARVVLMGTAARWDPDLIVATFRRLGGDEAADAASAYLTDPTEEHRATYRRVCGVHYSQRDGNSLLDGANLSVLNSEVSSHWFTGEGRTFDTRDDLRRAQCPVLVMQGVHDPITPFAMGEEVAACLPAEHAVFEPFAASGHDITTDEPDRAFALIRSFVAG